MLLIANESLQQRRPLLEVARELSLTLRCFANTTDLNGLLEGRSRRIVVLTEADLVDGIVDSLDTATSRVPPGIIIAASPEGARPATAAAVLDALLGFANAKRIRPDFDFDELSAAVRGCRRRMLRLSREDLEQALAGDEFLLQYQPKVERSAGAAWLTREVEALIRWHHPTHGLIGPLEFLPEVEAFDLTGPVSEFVLRQAARQLIAWRRQDLTLKVCINLASSLLKNRSIADRYAEIVAALGLDGADFMFEVSAKDLANPDSPHVRTLEALRDRGFRICLDDFRVAAASLGVFDQLPFDEIKINASALKRAQDSSVATAILAAVTGLAQNLGISVCAAGVEDRETFEFLRTIECDKMQGFLISEAVLPGIIRRVYSTDAAEVEHVA